MSDNINDIFENNTFTFAAAGEEEFELTIAGFEIKEVPDQHGNLKKKPILSFEEDKRKLWVNPTNAKVIGRVYGPFISKWIGRKIIVWGDPDVTYGGRVTGGMKVRVPKKVRASPTADDTDLDGTF